MRTQSLSLPDLTTFLSVRGLSVLRRQIQYGWHFCDSGVCLCHEDKYSMADISVTLGSVCAMKTNTVWLTFLWLWGLPVPWRQIQYGWHFCDCGVCMCHEDKYNVADISVTVGSVCAMKTNTIWLAFLSIWDLSVPWRQIQCGWHFCQSGVCLRHHDKYNVADFLSVWGLSQPSR